MAGSRAQRPLARAADQPALLDYLTAHRMFGVLPPVALAELAGEIVERRYPKAHHLCFSGDQVSHVFIVKSGLIALTDVDERGNTHAMVTYSPGNVFGAAAAALGVSHTGTATALVDSELLVVRADTFQRWYRRSPELAHEVLRELHRLASAAQQTIFRLTVKQVTSRIAAFLLTAATEAVSGGDEPLSFDLALSHQDMALLVGTTRVTVTRVLTRFARAKLIAVQGRRVVILKPDALRQLTES